MSTAAARTAWRNAARLKDPETRCIALLALIDRFAGAEKEKILREALTAAQAIAFPLRRNALVRRVEQDLASLTPKAKLPAAKKTKATKGPISKKMVPPPFRGAAKKTTRTKGVAKRTAPKAAAVPTMMKPGTGKQALFGTASGQLGSWLPPQLSRPAGWRVTSAVPAKKPSSKSQPPDLHLLGFDLFTKWPAPTKNNRPPSADSAAKSTASTPERFVNLGLSDTAKPDEPLGHRRTLITGERYYFWLEVGGLIEGSFTDESARLPLEHLPKSARLDVVLFANPGGFELDPNKSRGQLVVQKDASVIVKTRASIPKGMAKSAEILKRRLFFGLRAPAKSGTYQLRCCIYYRGLLVQSHDIRAVVDASKAVKPARRTPTLSWRLDYTLSRSLTPQNHGKLGKHQLSILFNDNDDGTHGFRFFAEGADYHRSASIDAHTVQDLLKNARRAYRIVSWGTKDPYDPRKPQPYRYAEEAGFAQLTRDLARLAKVGYRIYDAIANALGAGPEGAEKLRETMRRPGVIQLALKESARLVLPLALLYDYRIDPDCNLKDYTLCESFVQADRDLAAHACFKGDCPNRDVNDNHVICPSGFWGFRHAIGLPVTLGGGRNSPADLPGSLQRNGALETILSVSMDPQMQERDSHILALKRIIGEPGAHYTETRTETLKLLRNKPAHLVYFYCHGGIDEDDETPYIQIGKPNERISRATLRSSRIRWVKPRSLVFINGCHTTDLEPERAIELVSGFVETAGASGVIGTEITIFEPLATAFAEHFLREFVKGRSLGEAVRRARLRILQKGFNPLGLLYVPFALSTLTLS